MWWTFATRGGAMVQTSTVPDARLRMASERFYEFYKHLKELDGRVKEHYANLEKTANSRALVMETLQNVSRDTPLEKIVTGDQQRSTSLTSRRGGGAGLGGASAFSSSKEQSSPLQLEDGSSTTSASSASSSPFAACYSATLDAKKTVVHLERYRAEIVSYVSEWEQTVSARVAAELKHIAALYKTWDRYRSKVQGLKQTLEKKKQPNKALEDKLAWNESKLRNARREYRRNLVAVTLLTEEVTDRAWKELVPLLIRMIDFDGAQIKNSKEVGKGLLDIREEMVQLSRRYEMDFEAVHTGRLRILREEDALDFVNPEDLQDLESTVFSSFDRLNSGTAPNNTLDQNNHASPLSDRGGSRDTQEDEPEADENQPQGLETEKDLADQQKADDRPEIARKECNDDEDDGSSCAVPNFPRSIYLAHGGSSTLLDDDETTLTGVPDLASV